jgi:hypothetical protein
MAVIKKTLFPKNLEKFAVLVDDTQSDSKYFKITELPGTFTGGKNSFLIAGSDFLVPDTKIQIELKDSAGNIIYHEPGEGMINTNISGSTNTSIITEYYEGVSKVVAVYVYPDTAYGPCTLTILGELSEYEDANGLTLPVPLDWENKYNVKWQKQIDVNPSLANTTKIRFYQRPTATITELLSPLYRIENDLKVASAVTQSFADIKLSRLETFAGDVKRIKVFRTSDGDISDYDLIQDILVESKELLTTFGLSGSVVGETGILTSETLKNYWKTGSLNAFLTSSKVESGVRLTGSGYFTYSSSLDIKSSNTYELNLDAFYSSSTSSNLGIYLSYLSQSTTFTSSLATLVGTTPTKNLLDTVIPFRIDRDYPSASLYFSQSQGEWHLGNISLRLSQDTAFSPDEVSFVTTMPSVLGNEIYNFKFEFYDVNNNYVPVEVTQSALFTGGNNNLNGTLTLISSSTSASLDIITKVSSSISGTMTVYSSSASGSIGIVSSSVSALSSSISSSNSFILSSSLSKVQQLANGQFSGSFIGDTFIYSPTIGGQQGYISELFKVGTTPSIYLDARQNPRKIFIGGVSDSGSYNNSNTTVYMDSTGKFSLGNQLSWNGSALTINGTINVTGGNAATDANALLYASRAVTSGSVSANAAQTAAELFAASAASRAVTSGSNASAAAQAAAIAQAKSDASASINLLANGDWTAGNTFISSRSISSPVLAGNAGYISEILKVGQNGITLDGGNKKIFVGTGTYNNSNTPFYFASGSTNVFSLGDKLTFNGSALSVNGSITATSLTATTTGNIAGWSFNSTQLSSGNIIINSSTPKISIEGAGIAAPIYFSTADITSLNSTFAGSTYMGNGGIQFSGEWTSGKVYPKSFARLATGPSYASLQVINANFGYASAMATFAAYPNTSNAAVRIDNGGLRVRNLSQATSINDYTVNYAKAGNGGYAIYCEGENETATSLYVYGAGSLTGDLTANTSDKRLKTNIKNIDSPLEKLSKINGVYFNWNDKAKKLASKDTEIREVGFIAQEVQSVLPEIIKPAPFDTIDANGGSKSGENYLTIQYEKVVPLLVECIKELQKEIEELKKNK